MRRIAFYLSSFPGGGLERVTLTLMSALVARGHQVDLVLEQGEGAFLAQLPCSVRCIVLQRAGKWRACAALIRHRPGDGLAQAGAMAFGHSEYIPLGRLSSLVAYLRQDSPDVMIAAAGRVPFLALWAGQIAGGRCAIVVAEHSTFSQRLTVLGADRQRGDRLRHRGRLMRRLYPLADAVVAVSSGVADDVATTTGIARARISVLYNPVAAPATTELDFPLPGSLWAEADEAPLILAVGRLAPEKGFDDLVAAFALVRRRGVPARLLILGEGPERARLERLIDEYALDAYVRLPGWHDEPGTWMRHSDVFVLSSRLEGLPLTLIEAMAHGCRLVATDCRSGPREILEDGRWGRLVPVGEPAALANALCQALQDDVPDSAGQRHRAEVFGVERCVDAYEELIDRVCR